MTVMVLSAVLSGGPNQERKSEVDSMIEAKDLQERLLFRAQELQKPVLIFTMNGFQMRGVIVGSDRFVIALRDNKGLQMVYKHAISTVVLAEELYET